MKKRLIYLFFAICCLTSSCNFGPFLKVAMNSKKAEGTCKEMDNKFLMNSNFGGDRFQFQQCLPSTFNNDNFTAIRQGDTVVIKFSNVNPPNGVLFDITIDIDTSPRYHFITINESTFTIVPSGN